MSAKATASAEVDFEAVIGPLVEPALRLAFSMLGSRAEAEDATQEAITQAWRKLPQLRDRSNVRPWFLSIVANRCRNVRRTRWFSTVRLPELFRPGGSAEERVEHMDIERALARLPMGDRQILFMHYYLDLPVEEIAASLRITPAAAKGRIYRAVHRMRPDMLEEEL
jgi:RNA polymerase sigma-70 factor (ECF subfamily)